MEMLLVFLFHGQKKDDNFVYNYINICDITIQALFNATTLVEMNSHCLKRICPLTEVKQEKNCQVGL